MSNAHKAVYGRLSTFPGLTALVVARIYPGVMPQNSVMPVVVYHQIGGNSEKGSLSDPPLKMAQMQVTAFDKTLLGARAVADQILLALDRLRAQTVNGVAVDDCIYQGDVDLFDPDTMLYMVPVTFRLHFRE